MTYQKRYPQSRKWQLTSVFLPGKLHGRRNLAGYSPGGHKRVRHELVTEPTHTQCIIYNFYCCVKQIKVFIKILWLQIKRYPQLSEKTLKILLLFPNTNLYEAEFHSSTSRKVIYHWIQKQAWESSCLLLSYSLKRFAGTSLVVQWCFQWRGRGFDPWSRN